MRLLVLDEQLANPRLVSALRDRGIEVQTVSDFGVTGIPIPTSFAGSRPSIAVLGSSSLWT